MSNGVYGPGRSVCLELTCANCGHTEIASGFEKLLAFESCIKCHGKLEATAEITGLGENDRIPRHPIRMTA